MLHKKCFLFFFFSELILIEAVFDFIVRSTGKHNRLSLCKNGWNPVSINSVANLVHRVLNQVVNDSKATRENIIRDSMAVPQKTDNSVKQDDPIQGEQSGTSALVCVGVKTIFKDIYLIPGIN